MQRLILLVSFAFRDAARSKVVLVLVLTSLSVAFAASFLSASILDGFNKMLEDGAINSIGHLVITPAKRDKLSIENVDEVAAALKRVANVAAVSVRSSALIGIRYNNKLLNPYKAVGVEIAEENRVTKLSQLVVAGYFVDPVKPKEVVLGLTIADALVGLIYDKKLIQVGERIKIITTAGERVEYRVGGVIDGKAFLPNSMLLLPKQEVEKLDSTQKNSEIVVRLKEPLRIEETKREIERLNLGVRVATWHQEAGYIDDIIAAVSFITGLINRLLILSVFLITSIILFINVLQRRKQIGIIKSMGASNAFLVSIYILESFIYSILSYLLGVAIFVVIHIYSSANPIALLVGDFSTVISERQIWISLLTLTLASLAGSIIPAYLAAKTNIIKVIREYV
ncbi:MAG: ABC transporter permease [bacterium]|nr:ABC transporter permease [bacterium]